MDNIQAKLDEYVKKYRLNVDYIREINDNQLVIDLVLLAESKYNSLDNKISPSELLKLYYICWKTNDNFLSDFVNDRDINKVSDCELSIIRLLRTMEQILYSRYKNGVKDSISKSDYKLYEKRRKLYYSDFRQHIVYIIEDNSKSYFVESDYRYKRSDYIEHCYGKKKIDCQVLFNPNTLDDLLRLTIPQQTNLIYKALSAKYRDYLIQVSDIEQKEFEMLCQCYDNIPSAKQLTNLFNMGIKLSQLATFGVGHEANRTPKYTWCYNADFLEDRAVYTGYSITWEEWSKELKQILDNTKYEYKSKENIYIDNLNGDFITGTNYTDKLFNKALYYQNGYRLTVTQDVKNKIILWRDQYIMDDNTPFPFSGKINNEDEEYSFTINYFTDITYKDRQDINKEKGYVSGISRIRNNAYKKLRGYNKEQIITTKELHEHGYLNNQAIKRITGIIIEKVAHGKYKMLIDIPP